MVGKAVFEWVTLYWVAERHEGRRSGQGTQTGIDFMYSDSRKQAHEALGLLAGHTMMSVSLFAVACPPPALG